MSVKTAHPNQTHEAGHKQPTAKPAAKRSIALTPQTDLSNLRRA